MKAANWTNESTFKKFYHKPVFNANLGGGGGSSRGGGWAIKHTC